MVSPLYSTLDAYCFLHITERLRETRNQNNAGAYRFAQIIFKTSR